MPTTLTLPTIHLGGTSRNRLADEQDAAATAIRAALESLHESAPNGRDYYRQGPDALQKAEAEHASRVDRLRSVLAEIEAIQVHIAES